MQIHFFGRAGDQVARSVDLDLPSTVVTVADLRRLLAQSYPHAAGEIVHPSLRACVGDELVGEDHELCDSDFVEFLPPLSGG